MKPESDPITDDEWLLRLVWDDRFVARQPPISLNAFEPRDGKHPDKDGLSLFREACVNDPTDILAVVAADKRDRYGIVKVPVSLLAGLRLTARSSPIPEVPGHVVLPELNITAYKADAGSFLPIKAGLAQAASENIVRRPLSKPGG
ncbi:MAG: hypothetical protein ACRC33_05115 [Gemmataceae bacterium]